jgi:23S rRNA pseudouridine1911/1915/1917 synthase
LNIKDKAYKVLATQEGLSNKKAKELIDRGLVYIGERKVKVARAEVDVQTRFKVTGADDPTILYEDAQLVVIDKPAFFSSEELERKFGKYRLLHRLDKETSGVLVFTKDNDFRTKAIAEFNTGRVYKEYIAWVDGIIGDKMTIDEPLLTIKGNEAFTKVSPKGKEAITHIEPIEVHGKKSKLKVIIETGRTHQIRAHLKSIGHPIIGDNKYGGREYRRILLHAHKFSLLEYDFSAKIPCEFNMN